MVCYGYLQTDALQRISALRDCQRTIDAHLPLRSLTATSCLHLNVSGSDDDDETYDSA